MEQLVKQLAAVGNTQRCGGASSAAPPATLACMSPPSPLNLATSLPPSLHPPGCSISDVIDTLVNVYATSSQANARKGGLLCLAATAVALAAPSAAAGRPPDLLQVCVGVSGGSVMVQGAAAGAPAGRRGRCLAPLANAPAPALAAPATLPPLTAHHAPHPGQLHRLREPRQARVACVALCLRGCSWQRVLLCFEGVLLAALGSSRALDAHVARILTFNHPSIHPTPPSRYYAIESLWNVAKSTRDSFLQVSGSQGAGPALAITRNSRQACDSPFDRPRLPSYHFPAAGLPRRV